MNIKYINYLIILAIILVIFMLASGVRGQEQFDFPFCQDQTGNGNIAHYDTGLHQIAGNGLLEGSDDVYSLEDGYFLQCFCSPEGQGIQTNWTQANGHEGTIWGEQWNLGSFEYLYENIEYDCSDVTPTPTVEPTATPSATPSYSTPSGGHVSDGLSDGRSDGLSDGGRSSDFERRSPYDGSLVGWK